ncbi:hypothetical protein FGO68_gene16243 [Halteria grandinella]|uniref:Glutathione S-transferase n=1 Tax=Halteria grandinella TaxID=5974 RepID=A0A8J8NJU4_HALGN|nr:hypothetical protein FGO68_gene16243 [Halteria grandinella]
MTAKIYGHPLSIPTRIAQTVAKRVGQEAEFVLVDVIAGAQFEDSYKKLNPNQKIPLYQSGDFTLSESYAIAKYLTDRGEEASALYPREAKTRATIDMHLGVFNDLKTNALQLDYQLVINPKMFKVDTDAKVVAKCDATVKKILGEYEAHLSGKKYILGDSFTILDLIFTLQLLGLAFVSYDFGAEFPTLRKYYDDILAEQADLKAQHDEFHEGLKALA